MLQEKKNFLLPLFHFLQKLDLRQTQLVSNAVTAFASIQTINFDSKEKQVHLAVTGSGE